MPASRAVSPLRQSPPTPGPTLPAVGARLNYREQVAHALRAALVAGELRPGTVYSAPMLAAQFGVSATPVREAMLDLAREGLVDAVPNKGFRVTDVTEKQLDEYTRIRELIEIPVTTDLAGTVQPEQLERLRPQAEAIVTAAEAGDLVGYVEADRAFHLDLLSLAGNAHLLEVVSDLRKRTRLYGLEELAERGLLVSSAREHVELLDALLTGNKETVRTVITRHLGHVRSLWAKPA